MLISSARGELGEFILKLVSRIGLHVFRAGGWPELTRFLLVVGALICVVLFVRSLVLKARTVTTSNSQFSGDQDASVPSGAVGNQPWAPLATGVGGEPYGAISDLLAETHPGDPLVNHYLENPVLAGNLPTIPQSSTHTPVAVSLPARTLLGFMIESGDYIMSPDGRWERIDIVVLISEDEADLLMRPGASEPILRVRLEEQYQIRRG